MFSVFKYNQCMFESAIWLEVLQDIQICQSLCADADKMLSWDFNSEFRHTHFSVSPVISICVFGRV